MVQREQLSENAPHYRAFISYSHADTRFANWLHRRLESYGLPDGAKLRPIFLDRVELSAGADLSQRIQDGLAQSGALIVIASPAAKASRWVGQEIDLFQKLHPDRPVLTALCLGEPDEAFPSELLFRSGKTVEPLAADFRKKGDGRQLGLLKLLAGLTGQPLDNLVQRDAKARMNRVMAITGLAVAAALIMAVLLVFAIRARSDAERQRAKTEGMVEFMLTDLRSKLKGVGRLDIMSAVNQRAMAHYAAEKDLTALPDDSLERRARLLSAMGEDDWATTGGKQRATREFAESYRITANLLARAPDNTSRIFAHAQNEYWMGYVAYYAKDSDTVRRHWTAYRDLAQRLMAIDANDRKWRQELGYAESNLCTLALAEPVDPPSAIEHCGNATEVMEGLALGSESELEPMLEVAKSLAWQADAYASAGKIETALGMRQKQRKLASAIKEMFPADARAIQQSMLAEIGLGLTLIRAGQIPEARMAAERASSDAVTLKSKDPHNRLWYNWREQISEIKSAT